MRKHIRHFILFSYLMFFLFIGLIGMVMYLLNMPSLGTFLQTVSAWSPTFVFLIMFKRIYPADSRLRFIQEQFSVKVEPRILLVSILLPLMVFLGTLGFVIFFYQIPVNQLVITSPVTLLYMLPVHLIAGPLGEELGWRSFLSIELEKKYSLLASAVRVGLIWGFWHLPLWLVSGLAWGPLLVYVSSFLISIVCCSIIIGLLYNKCRNLSIPILVHLLNNYLIGLFTFNMVERLAIYAFFYVIVTVSLILINKHKQCRVGCSQIKKTPK
ncbi:CAAX protease self-immunity [Amphibacillus marinus]|uniref:CAAX protease self-immunity n=1 Tax=Amphibacillus marinus TaxID=872970 RepID=A0A1H8KFL3_9BACI|nr:type II CAAX endopeptidase family protein [Amphibacillus marinus]SEN91739.1 CAAX protease self-immunity [Amphibacillus marinus]